MLLLTPWAAKALHLLAAAWILACPFVAWRCRANLEPWVKGWRGAAILPILPVLALVPATGFKYLFPFVVFALWAAIFAEHRSSGNIGGKLSAKLGVHL